MKKPIKENERNNGYTLTEVIVTVSLIGTLSTIALPNYTRSVCKSNQTEAISEITMLQTAAMSYTDEYGATPTSWEQINSIMPVQTLTGSGTKTTASGQLSTSHTLRSNRYTLSASSSGPVTTFRVEPTQGCINYDAEACVNTQNGLSDITKGETSSAAIATTCT